MALSRPIRRDRLASTRFITSRPAHTKGWCRELGLESLGLPAVLPPPEEKKDVKTAVEAAHAAEDREVKTGSGGRPQARA